MFLYKAQKPCISLSKVVWGKYGEEYGKEKWKLIYTLLIEKSCQEQEQRDDAYASENPTL